MSGPKLAGSDWREGAREVYRDRLERDAMLAWRDVDAIEAMFDEARSEQDRRRIVARALDARRRLVALLVRASLPLGASTEAFVRRLVEGLEDARLGREQLGAIANALDPETRHTDGNREPGDVRDRRESRSARGRNGRVNARLPDVDSPSDSQGARS